MCKIMTFLLVCVCALPMGAFALEQDLRSIITEIFAKPPFDVATVVSAQSDMPTAAAGKEKEWARISSDYGYRKAPSGGGSTYHQGIDFGIQVGTPLFAQAHGKIISMTTAAAYNGKKTKCEQANCSWECGSCKDVNKNKCAGTSDSTAGITTVVCYGNGIAVAYYHLSKHPTNLRVGSVVEPGDIIGYSGNTGAGCSGHLHYQVSYTPDDLDECNGWNQTKTIIDPLCPLDFSTMPYYFKNNRKNMSRNDIMKDKSGKTYTSICQNWEFLDGELDHWVKDNSALEDVSASDDAFDTFWTGVVTAAAQK